MKQQLERLAEEIQDCLTKSKKTHPNYPPSSIAVNEERAVKLLVELFTTCLQSIGGLQWVKHLGQRVTFGFKGRKRSGIIEGYHPTWGVVIFEPSNVMIPYHYVREELIEWPVSEERKEADLEASDNKSSSDIGDAPFNNNKSIEQLADEYVEGWGENDDAKAFIAGYKTALNLK